MCVCYERCGDLGHFIFSSPLLPLPGLTPPLVMAGKTVSDRLNLEYLWRWENAGGGGGSFAQLTIPLVLGVQGLCATDGAGIWDVIAICFQNDFGGDRRVSNGNFSNSASGNFLSYDRTLGCGIELEVAFQN